MLLRRKGVAMALTTGLTALLLLAGSAMGEETGTIQIFGATLIPSGSGTYIGKGVDGSLFTHDTKTGITHIRRNQSRVEIYFPCGVVIEHDESGQGGRHTLRKEGALSKDEVMALQALIDKDNANRSAVASALPELDKAREGLKELVKKRNGIEEGLADLKARGESIKAEIYRKLDARDGSGLDTLAQQLRGIEGQIKTGEMDVKNLNEQFWKAQGNIQKMEKDYNALYKASNDSRTAIYDYLSRRCDPKGTQTSNIPGFWTPTNIGIATGLVVIGGAVAVGSGGGGSTTPTGGGTPGGTVPSSAEIPGTYSLSGTKTSDPCNIGSSTISNPGVPFTASNGTVSIRSTATMTGNYNSSTGSYTGTGVANDIKETFNGTFTKNGAIRATGALTFENLAGSHAGCIRTYGVTYTKN